MPKTKFEINRAPVLTLWATVVAERLGYDRDEALTLAKGLAGLNAQSKGRRLGIYEEGDADEKEKTAKKAEEKVEFIELMGRGVPAVKTSEGLRAAVKGRAVHPQTVQRYLEQKFGDHLEEAQQAMEKLAKSLSKKELESKAYPLYEKFRPEIPEGKKGWGAKGELDLEYIRSLASEAA